MDQKWVMPESLAASSCSHKAPTMSSDGLWGRQWREFLQHPMPLLEMQLFSIFILHYLLQSLHKHLKLPWPVIHGLVGILIGQILRSNKNLSEVLMHDEAENVITTLTSTGFVLFNFITSVKMDPAMVKKSGKQAWTMGTLCFLFPTVAALPLFAFVSSKFGPDTQAGLKFFFFQQSLTPFPVISCLLTDLKILNSELGRLASASALISFLCSVTMAVVFIIARIMLEVSFVAGVKMLFFCSSFVGLTVFVVRPAMFWIIKQTPEGKPVRESFVISIAVLAVGAAVAGDFMGMEYMFGPFILGLAVPDGPPMGSTLADRLDTVISGMVVPLFMTYGGYRTDLSLPFNAQQALGVLSLVATTTMGKVAAGSVMARTCGIPYKDAFALALILSAKGIVDMCLYITCNDKKQMDNSLLSMVHVSVLIVATAVPFAVKRLYDPSKKYAGYQKRNILHAERNAELKVLPCVFRQDDAMAVMKLLEAYGPSRESPLSIYVLHLVELVGRATPLLIDHQLGQRVSSHAAASGGFRTQHIIDVFNYYSHQNPGAVAVQVFTAVSPAQFMNDDICSIAFDKMASLVLLPFHRKWGAKGKVIMDDNALRATNCLVLDKAPCSVGILIDRRKVSGAQAEAVYSIGMLFLGGDDDREALVLCKRMARCPEVRLTVVRLVAAEESGEDRWERMLDAETLKEVKLRGAENVAYVEERVGEGSETAKILREMERQFELIVVGRGRNRESSFTTGLGEWSEFLELGPVGDLLASSDVTFAASALVVQQQRLSSDNK